jgi:hypothetical protein
MADFQVHLKAPTETIKEFNLALRQSCKEAPITDFRAAVVDGQPCIVLISSLVPPTPEDIQTAKADGVDINPDDEIPESDPLVLQVAALSAHGPGHAATGQAVEKLAQRADGAAEEVEIIAGPAVGWSFSPDDLDQTTGSPKPNARMTQHQTTVSYLVLSYQNDDVQGEAS